MDEEERALLWAVVRAAQAERDIDDASLDLCAALDALAAAGFTDPAPAPTGEEDAP